MIDDEARIRTFTHSFNRMLQVPRVHKQIVGQPSRAQFPQAANNARLSYPIIRRLALDEMSYTFELCVRSQFVELSPHAFALQINPANYTGDEWILICQLQQPSALCNAIARLYQDRPRDAVRLQDGLKRPRQ